HTGDLCMSIGVSCGPATEQGWHQLHMMLPGDELTLRRSEDKGVECVDVISDNIIIGRMMLTAASKALEIIERYDVKGVYVAEQNSYGDSDIMSMRVIIFYAKCINNEEACEEAHDLDGNRRNTYSNVSGLLRKVAMPAEVAFRLNLPGSSETFTLIQN
ncbi:MAG: hypothetical protein NC328_08470, partial [Muribaculum sp.]|nr:hypothetical protein [Muribaculum sp.]